MTLFGRWAYIASDVVLTNYFVLRRYEFYDLFKCNTHDLWLQLSFNWVVTVEISADAFWNVINTCYLYPPYVIGAIIFIALWLLYFFPRLISAAGDWMSTIFPHMVWP